MDTLKAFLHTAANTRYYEFFEVLEAPSDSVFSGKFSLKSLETRPVKNSKGITIGADFFNKTGDEISISMAIDIRNGGKADIDVHVKELEIRSFYVFKNDGFFGIPVGELKEGFSMGLVKGSEKVEAEICKKDAERLFSKVIK